MDDRIAEAAVCGPDGCEVPSNAPEAIAVPPQAVTRLDVVSDAICPWCWVGKRNLDRALDMLAEDGEQFEIHWRPFQLNPDMPREGVDRASYRAAKFGSLERSTAADARVAQAGALAGLEFRHDLMRRTPNTLDAHRVIALAGALGLQHQVVEALFQAYFHDGRDIGDREELARIAGEAGLDAEEVATFLASNALEADIVNEDAGFRHAGLSGVPTFALAGHVLFSGAMPAEDMAEAVRRGLSILRERGVLPARA
jgi:predicted DsbA family dithiol-disulfide isomerase